MSFHHSSLCPWHHVTVVVNKLDFIIITLKQILKNRSKGTKSIVNQILRIEARMSEAIVHIWWKCLFYSGSNARWKKLPDCLFPAYVINKAQLIICNGVINTVKLKHDMRRPMDVYYLQFVVQVLYFFTEVFIYLFVIVIVCFLNLMNVAVNYSN